METERLKITLDQPDKIYFAGQTIKGIVWINLAKKAKIRAIKVQITGKGKCKWMEILRKSSNNESARSLFYSSKEVYAQNENTLPEFEPRGLELSAGEHSFQYSLSLDPTLPSSFKGSYGSIKYKLRFIIQKPWTFDERHIIPIAIIKHMPLPYMYRLNPTSLEKQITKTISLFGTRPITMLAMLPEDFAVRGEPLRICVTVTNNSTTNVEKLRFSVLQHITYYSHLPLRIQKFECITITLKETGAVHKKSERSFAHELLIPETVQPTDDQYSGVINIAYELRVEAVLRGFFKNLVLNLPFKMYSIDGQRPSSTSSSMRPPPTGAEATTVGNPFDPPLSTQPPYSTHQRVNSMLPVYPSLDSSVGSPSHSSQYSEESTSSLNSTTSDSSATTLSPALNNGTNLSYSSGTSSQFNSPSARASLRSSNVPYMPYSSSPLMTNSYPPHVPANYALPESPQYTLMTSSAQSSANQSMLASSQAQATASPSSYLFSFGAYSSYSTLQRRQHHPPPPGAHELPPSYDELFGNPTAPPEAPK